MLGVNHSIVKHNRAGTDALIRDYDFIRKDKLHQDIEFSRASGATQTNSSGLVAFAPHNFLPYSENFGHSDWSKFNAATDTSTITDPFLGTGSYVFKETSTATNNKLLIDSHAVVNGGTYIFSVYAKAKELSILQLILGSVTYAGGNNHANFDLTNGAVTATGGGCVAKIEKIGSDGWYRCSIADTTSASGSTETVIGLYNSPTAGRASTYAGNGSDGIYIFGAMSEQTFDKNASPSAYLKSSGGAEYGARFDYDHAASLSTDITESNKKGLLIEEARTNLQANSSRWVSSTHSINNFNAIINDFAISPSGQRDAWRGECYDAGAARHEFYTRFNASVSTKYTQSLYIKPFGTVTHLKGSDGGSYLRGACFDLINCQIVEQNLTNEGATIEKITEDGWVRVSFTYTSVANNTDAFIYWAVGDAGSLLSGSAIFPDYDSGKGSGIYCWGVQQEAGSFPTSLIPTYGATASRSADVCKVVGTAFSRFHKEGTGGAWLVDSTELAEDRTTQSSPFAVYESNSSSLRIGPKVGGGATNTIAAYYQDGGDMIYHAGDSLGTVTKDVKSKIGITFQTNDGAFTRDGKNPNTDTSIANIYSPTELRIGGDKEASPTTVFCGHIARLRYFNKRILNSKLQKETSTDFLLNRYPRAKAAYSLRALMDDSTNSPVTRIRREYDSYEADYTAAQVSNGELEADFQSEKQTTLPLDVSVEADEMVVNGDFSANSDWNATAAGTWAIANGVASKTGVGSRFTQQIPTVKGKQYKVVAEIVNHSNGQASIYFEGSYSSDISSAGILEYTGVATDNSTQIGIYGNSGSIFSVDSISVKEVNPIATGFSTRKINSDYTGYAMRVRNNDDNIEAEVSFDENNEISLDSPVKATSMNLLPFSEDFSNSAWTKTNSAVTTSTITDPFGGTNAYKYSETSTANNNKLLSDTFAVSSGKSYTFSVYAKKGELDVIQLILTSVSYVGGNNHANFNLTSGTVTATGGGCVAKIEEVGTEGWYRCSLIDVTSSSGNTEAMIALCNSSSAGRASSYSGNGSDGIYIFGGQGEETVYASSGSNILYNGDFELDTSWNDFGSPVTQTQSTEVVRSGTYSRKITSTASGKGTQSAQSSSNLNLTAGNKYRVSAWIYAVDGGGSANIGSGIGNTDQGVFTSRAVTEGQWTNITYDAIATASGYVSTYLSFFTSGDTKTFYVDDVTVTELPVESPKEYTQTPVISDSHNSTSATNLREFCGKENLLPYSNEFTNSAWSNYDKMTANRAISPTGENNASEITTEGAIYDLVGSIGGNITVSIHAKKNTASHFVLSGGHPTSKRVIFDLETGVACQVIGGATHTSESLGNGWFRFSVTVPSHSSSDYIQFSARSSCDYGYNRVAGAYVYGAQINTGSTVKPYQETTGTPLTGDVSCVVWYDQGMGEDFVNDTGTTQPRIVMGSELVTDSGGKASLYFEDADFLENDTLTGQNRLDSYYLLDSSDDLYTLPAGQSGSYAGAFSDDGSSSTPNPNYTDNIFVNGALLNPLTRDNLYERSKNHSQVSHIDANTTGWTKFYVGKWGYAGYNFEGKISEMVFFPNMDSSTKRFPIEQNMLNHFDVNLVKNGNFDTDSDWTKQAGWSIANGVATQDGSQTGAAQIYQTIPTVTVGKKYQVTYDLTITAGSMDVRMQGGGGATVGAARTSSGSYTDLLTPTLAHTTLRVRGTDTFEGTIDNIKLKEVGTSGYVTTLYDQAGNNIHLEQSTAADQPLAISGGDTIKLNNRPTLRFNSSHLTSGLMGVPALTNTTSNPMAIVLVTRPDDASSDQYLFDAGINGTASENRQALVIQSNEKIRQYAGSAWANETAALSTTVASLLWAHYADVESHLDLNGTVDTSPQGGGSGALTSIGLGARMNNGYSYEGDISEFIIWPEDMESLKADAKVNINSHYNIYS